MVLITHSYFIANQSNHASPDPVAPQPVMPSLATHVPNAPPNARRPARTVALSLLRSNLVPSLSLPAPQEVIILVPRATDSETQSCSFCHSFYLFCRPRDQKKRQPRSQGGKGERAWAPGWLKKRGLWGRECRECQANLVPRVHRLHGQRFSRRVKLWVNV